jgi:chromosome segregation ATPase
VARKRTDEEIRELMAEMDRTEKLSISAFCKAHGGDRNRITELMRLYREERAEAPESADTLAVGAAAASVLSALRSAVLEVRRAEAAEWAAGRDGRAAALSADLTAAREESERWMAAAGAAQEKYVHAADLLALEQNRNSVLQQELEAAVSAVTAASTEKLRCLEQIARLSAENQDLREQIDAAEALISRLRSTTADLRRRIEEPQSSPTSSKNR